MFEKFDLRFCDFEIYVYRGYGWYYCIKRGLYLVYLYDKRIFIFENIRLGYI